jgi:hypothetical protein
VAEATPRLGQHPLRGEPGGRDEVMDPRLETTRIMFISSLIPSISHLLPGCSRSGFCSKSLQQCGDIYPQRSKGIRVEAIGLSLGWAEEIADCGAAQAIEETENPALLNG